MDGGWEVGGGRWLVGGETRWEVVGGETWVVGGERRREVATPCCRAAGRLGHIGLQAGAHRVAGWTPRVAGWIT